MKYFDELSVEEQEKVLDKLQDLPLFNIFRESAKQLLLSSRQYMFERDLKGGLRMHVIYGDEQC